MIRALPFLAVVLLVLVWHGSVVLWSISPFLLPPPLAVFDALVEGWSSLLPAALTTLKVMAMALGAALVSGLLLALAFSLSKTFEAAVYPIAVILQVTPVVSIAPLVLVWVGIDNVDRALIIIAWIVAFFPILANLTAGLNAVDRNLDDLFQMYGASPFQRFRLLLWPTAIPYLLTGLKISAGLALIGAVVAEFVAGSGGSQGLAWTILEAGNRLQMDRMMAGLIILSSMGVIVFYGVAAIERLVLRHRS